MHGAIDPEQLNIFETRLTRALKRFERAQFERGRARLKAEAAEANYQACIKRLAEIHQELCAHNSAAA